MLRFATRYRSNGVSSWLRQPACRYGALDPSTILRARTMSGDSFGALTDVEKIILDSVKVGFSVVLCQVRSGLITQRQQALSPSQPSCNLALGTLHMGTT
jgi:hypothetical protein